MEHLLLKAAVTAATDKGEFTAVISTATIDRERDIVDPNGFVKALQKWVPLGKKIPLLWHHGTRAADRVGCIDPATVQVHGHEVAATGKIDFDTPDGPDAWKGVKSGALGFSFGYLVPPGGARARKGGGKHILEVDVYEVTATWTPMQPDTRVLDYKAIKGHADVGPAARHHLESLIKYYMGKPHPFTCLVPETPIDAPRDHERHPDGIPMHDLRVGDLVWSFNVDRQVFELRPVEWAGPTRRNAAMVRVTLDNGEAILATPDHRFLLRDGTWREAGQLRESESLMPLYRTFTPRVRLSPEDGAGWHDEHRTVLDTAFGKDRAGLHAHHVDERYSNTHPTNFALLTSSEHRKRHLQTIQERFENCGHVRPCCDCGDEFAPRNAKHKRCDECREWRGRSRLPHAVVCPTCGVEFVRNSARHTYCTAVCQRNRAAEAYPVGSERPCARCGDAFVKRSGVQKFCSKSCRLASAAAKPLRPREGVNHKVVSVEHLTERRDMWDIQVEGNHNFVVHGVVLHNSCVKDNEKRFGPDGADKVCATLKDLALGTTHWRNRGKALADAVAAPVNDEPTQDDLDSMCQALYAAAEGDLEALLEMWHEHMQANGDQPKALSPEETLRVADSLSREHALRGARKRLPAAEIEDEPSVEDENPDDGGKAVIDSDEVVREAQALSQQHALRGARKQAETDTEDDDATESPVQAVQDAIEELQEFIDQERQEGDAEDVATAQRLIAGLRQLLQREESQEPAETPEPAMSTAKAVRDQVNEIMRHMGKSDAGAKAVLELETLRSEHAEQTTRLEQVEEELETARKQLTERTADLDTLKRAGDALTLDAVKNHRRREHKTEMPDGAEWLIPEGELEGAKAGSLKAVWTTAYVNNLPDSSFLHIESGGEKDSDGKTTPRSLRHFPYKDASGAVDTPHLRNALSRIPQSDLPSDVKDKLAARAQNILDNQKALVVDPNVTVDVTGQEHQGARSVDPLVQQAKAIAVQWRGHGVSRPKPPRSEEPAPRPEFDENELRREMRALMVNALSGTNRS